MLIYWAVNQADQDRTFDFCQRLETVGCFDIVLECAPESVAKQRKDSVSIPIITYLKVIS